MSVAGESTKQRQGSSFGKEASEILHRLGVADSDHAGGALVSRSPIDGSELAHVREMPAKDVAAAIGKAHEAFLAWRDVPAPRRGDLVRRLGEELRTHKAALARVITLETGKITSEGLGEVQEMIDICDFALGLSRQLYGATIASERPGHAMRETWHPLGVVGVITAFNFPGAVWSWNTAIALVCGDSVIWKPSEKTPLTSLAAAALLKKALAEIPEAPAALHQVIMGGHEAGTILVDDPRISLISATGSTRMGRAVAPRLAQRFARGLFELGGNNGMIVSPTADLDMAVRAILFAAAGTAGQRCTTLRRLFVHDSIYDRLLPRLKQAYLSVPIGSPSEDKTLVGPLIDKHAFDSMQKSIAQATKDGGHATGGERVMADKLPDAYYARPALVEMPLQTEVVRTETFAPILYVLRYSDLAEAIKTHNAVPQGLSSSIMTTDLREAELFMSARGSDCGIVNVNIGPSGAEIGGAFGGEKETGGGRESGSDSWKAYMRRATNTINYSRELPLAQGVKFDVNA
jgi:aldehyde dehydrogenase (NAD+)